MFRGIKIRLYPTVKQTAVLEKHLNAYRFCYNLCLEYKSTLWKDHGVNKTGNEMDKELRVLAKEVEWLRGCKTEIFERAAARVEESYKGFFRGMGFPKYKSKKGPQYFETRFNVTCANGRIYFFGNRIKFDCSGQSKELLYSNKAKRCVFSRDRSGAYWAAVSIECEKPKVLPTGAGSVGLDLGLKTFITSSNGEVFPNNRFLTRNQYKLRRLQRRLAKTKKGGKNRAKLIIKIAKLHREITWQRDHYFHQVSNKIISENQTIVVESLKVSNMVQNRKLSRAISDASWSRFINILTYKCNWQGRELIKIGTFYPSSKTCSKCGNVKEELLLSERIYNCEPCGHSIDRDLNAAINIRNIGTKTPEFKPVEGTPIGTH